MMISIISMILPLQLGTAVYSGEISQGSKLPFSIEFSEDALNKNSVEYQTLRNGVKKILGVVVGLLRDRACAEDDSPQSKRLE